MPWGVPILCPARASAATPRSRTFNGRVPAACTASVCRGTPCSAAISARVRMSWTVPTSLLASITETTATVVGSEVPPLPGGVWEAASREGPARSGRARAASSLADTRAARKDSGESTPEESTGSSSVSKPSCRASARADSRTASCSMALTSTRRRAGCRSRRARAMPLSARLSASVPPEVKTISPGRAPRTAAARSRASSSARAARWPRSW